MLVPPDPHLATISSKQKRRSLRAADALAGRNNNSREGAITVAAVAAASAEAVASVERLHHRLGGVEGEMAAFTTRQSTNLKVSA